MKGALAILGLVVLGTALFFYLQSGQRTREPALVPGRASAGPVRPASVAPELSAPEPAAGAAESEPSPSPAAVAPRRAVAARSDAGAPSETRARLSGALMSPEGPIEGGRVVYQSAGRAPLEVHSDRRGAFTLVFEGEQLPGVLGVRARGFALFELGIGRLRPGENRALGNINLARGVVLQGRVTDAAGVGLADATLNAASSHNTIRESLPLLSTRSEADGRFRLEDVPQGNVRLQASASGHGSRVVDVIAPAADLELALPPGATLDVRVLDEQGQPVAGAEVRLEPMGEGAPSELRITDTAGATRFADLGLPLWTVVVAADEFRPLSLEHAVEGGLLEVHLVRWPCIEGRVVAPGGTPAPPGTLLYAAHRTQIGDRSAPQGEGTAPAPDGSFRLCPVFPGAYEVLAVAPGFARTRSPELQIPIEGVVQAGLLTLTQGGTLVLVSGLQGQALAGAVVELYASEPHGGALWNAEEESPFRLDARALGSDGSVRFERLEVGSLWVVLRAPDFLPLLAGPFGIAAGVELFAPALHPERGGKIEGTLRTAGGEAVADAMVLIRGSAVDSVVRSMTDESGRFLSPALPPGNYRLWARVARSGATPVAAELEVEVRTGDTTTVEIEM